MLPEQIQDVFYLTRLTIIIIIIIIIIRLTILIDYNRKSPVRISIAKFGKLNTVHFKINLINLFKCENCMK